MSYLLLPPKRPVYRQDRKHADFLTKLRDHLPSQKLLVEQLKMELVKRFYIQDFDLAGWEANPHRRSVQYLEV
jgi:hypothetical protein